MQKKSCDSTSCFLCRHCQPAWLDLVTLRKENIFVKKGKALFREGTQAEGIFCVFSGAFKIHMDWGKEKELIVRFAKSGDLLGYRGLGNQDIHPVTATALEDSVVCFVTEDFWDASLGSNPQLVFQLMQFYGQELHLAEKRMHTLAHMEVKGRIADALLELLDVYGQQKDKTISVTLNRQDIASYAGTIYETVFKFFRELIHARIISTDGKRIKVLNKAGLRSFVK